MEELDITLIIPAFNEEAGLADTLAQLIPFAEKHGWKIFVVNDGSTDKTGAILSGIKGITVLTHSVNRGYGASLKTGIKNARTPFIVLYDADGQHDPHDVEKMIAIWNGQDMIIGARGKDSHQDWIRKPGKWILKKVAEFLTEQKNIPDLNSGLRLIKRELILPLLPLFPNGFSFSTTSLIAFMNYGYLVEYHPICVRKRKGKSSVKQIRHGFSTLLLILRLIVLFNPLKVFLPISFLMGALGFMYEILYGIVWFPNGVRLIPAAFFLMMTSIIVFFFGLVVDQLSEIRKNLYIK